MAEKDMVGSRFPQTCESVIKREALGFGASTNKVSDFKSTTPQIQISFRKKHAADLSIWSAMSKGLNTLSIRDFSFWFLIKLQILKAYFHFIREDNLL